jgi:hypothetical protein
MPEEAGVFFRRMAVGSNSVLDAATDEPVVPPSDRSFGVVFGVLFLVVGVAPLWRGNPARAWPIVVAAVLLAVTGVRPGLLAPANRVWFWIGLRLHRIVNPVVMSALFYLVVTPFGLVVRLARTDFVRRFRPDPGARTYWLPRDGTRSSMEQQF